ncbi:MAG: hypothetical protein SFV54_17285 [Bryobacteraceae bacterium]|nr:hypothetical protein [Bryobacteraceae bacterium]
MKFALLRVLPVAVAGLMLAAPAAAVDAELLGMVMPEARFVGGINVMEAKASPFGRFVLNKLQAEEEELQRFVLKTGLDPRQDIREMLMASTGEKAQTLLLAAGNFAAARLLSAAQSEGLTVTKYKDADIIVLAKPGRANAERAPWVALLNGNVAVIGEQSLVKAAVDRRGSISLKASLAQNARNWSTQYHAWMTTDQPAAKLAAAPAPAPGAPNNNPIRPEYLQAIDEASGGIRFGSSTVDIASEALARTDRDAQALVDVARFLASLAQGRQQQMPSAAAALLQSMNVNQQGRTVRLTATMPEADLEKLLDTPRHRPAAKTAARH